MSLITPRDYQEAGINATFQYFEENSGHPLLLYPTGTGKSVVIAGICHRALAWYPQTRIMMVTHVKELVDQNHEKLKMVWPEAPVGIFCDGLNRKEHYFPLTFGSIGSVWNKTSLFGYIDLVIVDEAHMISPKEATMYRKFIDALTLINPMLKVIGLTATGYRLGHGKLHEGKDALFTDVAFDCCDMLSFNWFLDEGYLVPPVPKPTAHMISSKGIKIRGGEFEQKSAQEAVDKPRINEDAVIEILNEAYYDNRQCGLIFGAGVDHCRHLWEVFEHYVPGEATWVASHGMTPAERDYNIAAYKDGEFKWMINNGILTTGFDYSRIDLIAVLRHMMSPGLWVQILGRGTRPIYAPGYDLSDKAGRLSAIAASEKQNTLVLDFCENTARLGPINDPVIPKPRGKGTGDAPIKICPITEGGCGCYNHAAATECWKCHHPFPRANKILATSGTKELVKKAKQLVLPKVAQVPVDRVVYAIHKKIGKPDSIKVEYYCGVRVFTEWVCLEHGGYAQHKSRQWWRERSDTDPPFTTAVAYDLVHDLPQPAFVKAVVNLPHGAIEGYVF